MINYHKRSEENVDGSRASQETDIVSYKTKMPVRLFPTMIFMM